MELMLYFIFYWKVCGTKVKVQIVKAFKQWSIIEHLKDDVLGSKVKWSQFWLGEIKTCTHCIRMLSVVFRLCNISTSV